MEEERGERGREKVKEEGTEEKDCPGGVPIGLNILARFLFPAT